MTWACSLTLAGMLGGPAGGWAQEQPPPATPPPQMRPDVRLAPDTQSTGPQLPKDNQGEVEDTYQYRDEGRRDPLDPLLKPDKLTDTLVPVDHGGRPSGPLERFDMSALQLVGIVWGNLGRRALVKAPDGKGYFVTVNTYMGKYGGKVVAIEEDYMLIEELYKNLEEKIIPKTLTIQLRRKDKKEG